jgi:hypothetical protein
MNKKEKLAQLEEETQKLREEVEKEESQKLESDFQKILKEATIKYKEQFAIIDEAQNKIANLSEESGIPAISYTLRYYPASFKNKWSALDSEFLEELNVFVHPYGGTGWANSSC